MNIKPATIILLITFFTNCKINYSFTGASIAPEVKTVSVKTFPNIAPLINPLLSNKLTEELKDRFMSQTNLQIVQSYGDLQFEGTILGYSIRPMNIQAGSDQAAQNRLTIKVKVKFINKVDSKLNYETTFSRYSDYSTDKNFQDVENLLVEDIVKQLVTDIFNKAVVNW
jgi:hypothetical protein